MPANAEDLLTSFNLPPEKAISKLKSLGIDTSGNFDEMLAKGEEFAFVISRVTNADLLQDVMGLLVDSLEQRQSFADFRKGVKQSLATRGWLNRENKDETLAPWRIELIYRNNIQSALSAGRFEGQLNVKDKRPWLVYDALNDNRTTTGCRDRDGIVRATDDPFWTTNYPPNHHRCRANVYSASDRELKRDGLVPTTDDELEKRPAPDKGWDRSPLQPFKPDVSKYAPPISNALASTVRSENASKEAETVVEPDAPEEKVTKARKRMTDEEREWKKETRALIRDIEAQYKKEVGPLEKEIAKLRKQMSDIKRKR
jgi:SPP1 gp7 family putative phage head morphogenesis protein